MKQTKNIHAWSPAGGRAGRLPTCSAAAAAGGGVPSDVVLLLHGVCGNSLVRPYDKELARLCTTTHQRGATPWWAQVARL